MPRRHLTTLALVALALTGCKEQASVSAPRPSGTLTPNTPHDQGLPGFFSPQPGEEWIYQVHRDLPPDSVLSDDDQLRSIDLPGGGFRLSIERRRVCQGTQSPEPEAEALTVFELSEAGTVTGLEFFDIGPQGLVAKGWKTSATSPDQKLALLTPGVLLASPHMAGGHAWTATGIHQQQEFHFRLIEHTTITVPAGTYEVARLEMNSGDDSSAIRRTLWFAHKVGIVKEESVYYGDRSILVRESAELISWTQPTPPETTPPEPVMEILEENGPPEDPATSTPIEEEPTPDSKDEPDEDESPADQEAQEEPTGT